MDDDVGVATRARTSCERCRTPPAGAELELDSIAQEHQPDSVAILDRRRGQKRGSLGRSICLGGAFRAKSHAGGNIDDQPQAEGALLDEPAHKRTPLTSRHVPVEVPDVISRLVGPQLGESQPDPRTCAMIGAGELRDRVGPDPKPQPSRTPDDRRGIQRSRPSELLATAKPSEHRSKPDYG